MNYRYIILALLVLLTSNTFAAEGNNLGLGVILGEPTGITGKYILDENSAIDAGAGWKTSGANKFHIYGDYLYHLYDIIDVNKGRLPLFFGAGVRTVIDEDDDDELGIRLPVGFEYIFQGIPIRIFGELVPVLDLTPDTEFDMEGGIGIRYFF